MSSSNTRDTVYCRISSGGVTGVGEGAPIVRYKEDAASAIKAIESVRELLATADPWQFTKLMAEVFKRVKGENAAKAALDKGQTKYTPTPCFPELKAAIAQKFEKENGLPYKPENVTTGAGGKHCLYMAFQAVLDPGDKVLIPSPYWVSYPEQVKLSGGVPKVIRGEESNGFKITPQQLQKAI